MRIALLQLKAGRGDPQTYRSYVKYLTEEKIPADTQLMALPELWTTGHLIKNIQKGNEEPKGPSVSLLAFLARTKKLYIVGGSLPIKTSQGIYNLCFIYGPEGCLGEYAKIHPFGPMGEKEWCVPGRKLCIFSTSYGKMGVMICYDLRFPEVARALTRAGAQVIFVPAAFPGARIDHWELLLRARAIENQVFMVGINKVGEEGNQKFPGKSLVVAPTGEFLVEGSNREELILCNLDLARIMQVRTEITCWQDFCPEAYYVEKNTGGSA